MSPCSACCVYSLCSPCFAVPAHPSHFAAGRAPKGNSSVGTNCSTHSLLFASARSTHPVCCACTVYPQLAERLSKGGRGVSPTCTTRSVDPCLKAAAKALLEAFLQACPGLAAYRATLVGQAMSRQG